MEGVEFVKNDKGENTAVIIDLKVCNELWEDFYDNSLASEREDEPRESLDAVRERLVRAGKLDA